MRDESLKQLKSGQHLFGEGGALAPLLKYFLESALEAEMSSHLDVGQRNLGNKRNGKDRKTMKTFDGDIEIETLKTVKAPLHPK